MNLQVTFYTAKWPSACAYANCTHAGMISVGEQLVILGERRPRSEKTKRPTYHADCWKALRASGDPIPEIQSQSVTVPAQSTPNESASDATNDLLATIANAVQPLLRSTMDESKVIELIKTHTSPVPQPITVTVNDTRTGTTSDMGIQHKQFPFIMSVVNARQESGYGLNIWLTGKAGVGKTTIGKAVAKALGVPCLIIGRQNHEYALTGFRDANSNYSQTLFHQHYIIPSVIVFDEIDSWSNDATLALNAATANGNMAFPDGMAERHKDCVIMAFANTWGLGATNDYVGRNKLDMAFLDRFVQDELLIDEALESATCGNEAWARRVQTIRRRVAEKQMRGILITPRASYFGAALLASGIPQADVERMTLKKAMTDDQWSSVSSMAATA